METPVERLRAYWLERGYRVSGGASPQVIADFEATHGIRLPEDARGYVRQIDGFCCGECDDELVEWYPIARWERVGRKSYPPPGLLEPEQYFIFADYCISAMMFAIRLSARVEDPTPVIRWCGDPEVIACSFSALIRSYLAEPSSLLAPRGLWRRGR